MSNMQARRFGIEEVSEAVSVTAIKVKENQYDTAVKFVCVATTSW